ncbi:MAG: hypothetical protein Q7S41_03730, partial [Candidatus Limnocylindria bacterium]|nr:hypothetical protein [Candidatus Limnocylindria bacterium]
MTETLAIPLDDVFCPCCQDDLGAAIRRLPHVVGAHVDLEHKVAHVTVHPGMTDAATLRRQIADCNFRNPVPLPPAQVSSHQSMHHAAAIRGSLMSWPTASCPPCAAVFDAAWCIDSCELTCAGGSGTGLRKLQS